MNKKTKITIGLIFTATAILVVAFILGQEQPDPKRAAEFSTEKSRFEKGNKPDPENHDHTITADMNINHDKDGQATITVTRGQVTNEAEKWEADYFNKYVDETLKSLPTLEQTKGLKNEEVHHVPDFLMETGLRLGKIKKQVKLNGALAPKAIKFYGDCAANEKSFTPIRGLCLANLVYMKKEEGEIVDLEEYPPKVRDLAQKALKLSF